MAQTVGNHTVSAFTSPVNGTSPIDANEVTGNDNTLRTGYNDHDTDPGIHLQSSALASRPAASSAGRKWLTADTGSYRLFFDDGTNWQELTYLRTDAGGTVTGNLTITGDLSVQGNTTLGNANTDTITVTGRVASNVEFGTDNTNDIGASGANRPRTLYAGTSVVTPLVTATTLGGTLSTAAQPNVTSLGTLTSLSVSGTATIGTLSVTGNTTIGDATSDTLTVNARLASDLDPSVTNTSDLGDTSLRFKDGWFGGTVTAGALVSGGSVTATGQVIAQVGSGSSVSYASTGDANTGLFFPGPDIMAGATGGTERWRTTLQGYFKASDTGSYFNSTGAYHEFNQSLASTCFLVRTTGAVPNAAGDYGLLVLFSNVATPGTSATYFSCADQNATRFSITTNGNAYNVNGTYGTLSDAKLKQDITDAGSAWDDIKGVRFRKYRLKSDVLAMGEDAPTLLGVVAQELEQTMPGLVDSVEDVERVEVGTNEDGTPIVEQRPTGTFTKHVKQSILLMKAAKALQEAMARIETLESRLSAAGIA